MMGKDILREVIGLIRCPKCKGGVKQTDGHLICLQCSLRYPIIDGIPVMRTSEKKSEYDDPEYARTFDVKRSGERADKGRRALIDKIAEIGQIKSDTKVLSVGAGTGLNEQFLNCDLICFDYSVAMLRLAREKGLRNLICADALELPFQENTFDCTFAAILSTLPYSEQERVATIGEMKRVTRKSGQIIVIIGNMVYKNIYWTLRYGNPKYDPDAVYPSQLKSAFKRQGITIIDNYTFFSFNPKLVCRAIEAIFKLLRKLRIDFLGPTIFTRGKV